MQKEAIKYRVEIEKGIHGDERFEVQKYVWVRQWIFSKKQQWVSLDKDDYTGKQHCKTLEEAKKRMLAIKNRAAGNHIAYYYEEVDGRLATIATKQKEFINFMNMFIRCPECVNEYNKKGMTKDSDEQTEFFIMGFKQAHKEAYDFIFQGMEELGLISDLTYRKLRGDGNENTKKRYNI